MPPPLACALQDVNVVEPRIESVCVLRSAQTAPPSLDALHEWKDVETSVSVAVVYTAPPFFAVQEVKVQ